jgi:hypothetical protein
MMTVTGCHWLCQHNWQWCSSSNFDRPRHYVTLRAGIFLNLLPRKVQALLIPSGGRVEVLVRCGSWPGKPLVLSVGKLT